MTDASATNLGQCNCCGEPATTLGGGKCDFCYSHCDADRPPPSHPSLAEREQKFLDEMWVETAKLRLDDRERWQTHRRLLSDHGHDANDLLAVMIMEDGDWLDWGLVVTRELRVLDYFLLYEDGYDLAKIEISDATAHWRNNAFATGVQRALDLAGMGRFELPESR